MNMKNRRTREARLMDRLLDNDEDWLEIVIRCVRSRVHQGYCRDWCSQRVSAARR